MYGLQTKFDEFHSHVNVNDTTTMILKAHLVIERQVLEFIKERSNDELFKKIKRIRSYFIIVLFAQSLAERDEIPCENNNIIWSALEKLGNIRNDIAHELEFTGDSLENKMRDFIKTVDYEGKKLNLQVTNENLLRCFYYAALSLCGDLEIAKKPLYLSDTE